jgi:Flp pilus assembly protein TadD
VDEQKPTLSRRHELLHFTKVSDYRQPNRDGLVPSGNRTLAAGSSDLVKRGLELAVRIPAGASDSDNTNFSDPDWSAYAAAKAMQNYDEMLKFARILVDRYPDCALAHLALGCVNGNLKLTNEAVAAFRRAINLKPDDFFAWFGLAWMYSENGRIEEAITVLRHAVEMKPDYADAWSQLGIAYRKVGQHVEAEAAFHRARELNPDLPE